MNYLIADTLVTSLESMADSFQSKAFQLREYAAFVEATDDPTGLSARTTSLVASALNNSSVMGAAETALFAATQIAEA